MESLPVTNTAEEKKKSILPWSLIIMGVSGLIFPVINIPNVFKIMDLTVSLQSNFPPSFYFYAVLYFGIIVVFLAQIVYGIRFLRKQKASGGLNRKERKKSIILFVAGIIAGVLTIPVIMLTIISPAYDMIKTIN